MKQDVSPGETRSVKRATELLRILARSVAGCSLTEIACQATLSKATVYRILKTLDAEGFVDHEENTGLYTVGAELVRISLAARTSSRLMAVQTFERLSACSMRSLSEATGETVALVIRQGDRRTNIAVSLGSHELIAVPKVGAHHPLHLGGPGKLILAFLPLPDREAFARRATRDASSPTRFSWSKQVKAELRKIRATGYATSVGEAVEGQASVAAPIYKNGTFVAALNLIVPAVRFDRKKQASFASRVKKTATEISELVEGAWDDDLDGWE